MGGMSGYGPAMPRYALLLEYDGRPFCGWQRQDDVPSVQGALEAALQRFTGEEVLVQGAGRTDAGVHARGQVAHLDLQRDWSAERLAGALNYHVRPAPIAVLDAAQVADDFHARFDAVERRYCYRILPRRAPLTLEEGQVWRVPYALDAERMAAAAALLVGQHDFTTFRASICQAKSPVKSLDLAQVRTEEGPAGAEIRLYFQARSFLHNQVRSFAGTLERVGAGRWPVAQVATALAARDRAACGPVAPPQGLALTRVIYPRDPFSPPG